MTSLSRLTTWYVEQCDGSWEHHQGISIQSTDNPGWWVKISLDKTDLMQKAFAPVMIGINSHGHPAAKSWLQCGVRAGTWEGAGDETRLEEIIDRFLAWAER